VHNALYPSANSKPSLANQPSFSGNAHQPRGNGHLAVPNSLSSSSLKMTSDGKPMLEHVPKAARSNGYGHGGRLYIEDKIIKRKIRRFASFLQ
jgi:hypothetical protein